MKLLYVGLFVQKNALINSHGFSPAQLVFGRNTNLPNFLDNKIPAQENPTSPDIALHISSLHAARRAFIMSESSNKLKLAMRKNIRDSGVMFKVGDKSFIRGMINLRGEVQEQYLAKMVLLYS